MATIEINIEDHLYDISTETLKRELLRRRNRSPNTTFGGVTYSKADLLEAIASGDKTHLLIVIDNLDLSL